METRKEHIARRFEEICRLLDCRFILTYHLRVSHMLTKLGFEMEIFRAPFDYIAESILH